MYSSTTFDEVAESQTLAAASTTLASPLAEVAATEVMSTAVVPDAVVAAAPAAPVVTAAVVAPAAPTPLIAAPVHPQGGLGTLPSTTAATLPMLGALLLVVGLILLLGKLVKRVQGARAGQGAALTIKGGVQIGAKERVVWMQAGDTHLLLGVSPGRVQTLHVFDVAPDFSAAAANESIAASAANTPATRDFSERLKTLLAHARAKGLDTDVASSPEAADVSTRTAAVKAAEPPRAATTKPTFSFRA